MNIILNGQTQEIPDTTSALQLVEILGLTGKRMAMEINTEIVPRSTFNEHMIQPDDNIEIVGAIGGG